MKLRKAQEEIMGFVVVIVLVAVVGLVVLGLSLRTSNGNAPESLVISQFLSSSMEYTTGCGLQYSTDYVSLASLLDACRQNRTCVSGGNACQIAENTLATLIEQGLRVAPAQPRSGFTFTAAEITNVTQRTLVKDPFLSLSAGNCTGAAVIRGTEYTTRTAQGVLIRSMLDVCSAS